LILFFPPHFCEPAMLEECISEARGGVALRLQRHKGVVRSDQDRAVHTLGNLSDLEI
jgi:hypothetical protein